jgi:hypothetical protein
VKAFAATAAVVLLTAGAVACGGGDSDGGAPSPPGKRQPSPKRPIAAELAPFNRAIATQSCRDYVPLLASIVRQRPAGTPASTGECRRPEGSLQALRGYRFSASQAYGTAALMEGPRNAATREYAIWALDGNGRFGYTREAGVAKPQIGSPFTRGAEASAVATRFIAAVRHGDCRAMDPLFSAGGRLAVTQGGPAGACRAVLRGRFLAPAVRASGRTSVRVMGGTSDLAFVGVPTRRGWFTMLLTAQRPSALRVLDVLPSTRVVIPPR